MTQLNDAFKDLEALKIKAKDMVRIAADLNQRLTASSTSGTIATEPEEATFIRSSLSQLGLQLQNAPVTQDMIRDEKKWFEELAKELAQILQGSDGPGPSKKRVGLMNERGVIALDEAWGGWNRARGIGWRISNNCVNCHLLIISFYSSYTTLHLLTSLTHSPICYLPTYSY
jgi:ESCRT-II complex subunit VPS36